MIRMARAHGGRSEHVLRDGDTVTLCGKNARPMAKFRASERGQDAKLRPVCSSCRDRLNT